MSPKVLEDDELVLSVKTAMDEVPLLGRVSRNRGIREAVEELVTLPRTDPGLVRVQQQLKRELTASHVHFVNTGRGGRMHSVPAETKLKELAVPRQLTSDKSDKPVPTETVTVTVQAYTAVGQS